MEKEEECKNIKQKDLTPERSSACSKKKRWVDVEQHKQDHAGETKKFTKTTGEGA